jgi:predicted dehydrogenase
MLNKKRDFVLFGGNFASKVLGVALADLTCSNYNICHISSSKKKCVIPQNIDTFFIAIPPNLNLKILQDMVPSNSNIFIEKPLSNNLEVSKKIKNLSIEKNLNIFVDFTFNFIDSFNQLSKILKNEDVVSYQFKWKTMTLQKNFKNNWKHDYKKGGGGLSNYISHIISYLVNNFGSISVINSDLNHQHIQNFIFDDCCGKILCKHSNNIKGKIEYDVFSIEEPEITLEVKTSKYIYKISNNLRDFFREFSLFRDQDLIFSENHSGFIDARIPIVKNALISFLNNKSNNKVDINHALLVNQIIDLIRLSSRKNKEIYVPKIFI